MGGVWFMNLQLSKFFDGRTQEAIKKARQKLKYRNLVIGRIAALDQLAQAEGSSIQFPSIQFPSILSRFLGGAGR